MKNIIKLFIIVMLTTTVADAFTQPPPMPSNFKELSLTVFLQGFYNTGNANMNQCKLGDGVTPKWSGTVVDTITVELHDASNYATIIYTTANGGKNIELNQNGSVNSNGKPYVEVPNTFTGNYYITIRSRNHLATTSANTVSFATKTISYDFSTGLGQAYGYQAGVYNPMILLGGKYQIYAGDIIQDDPGGIDLSDRTNVNNNFVAGQIGYNNADCNGDGITDTGDRTLINNNFTQFGSTVKHP